MRYLLSTLVILNLFTVLIINTKADAISLDIIDKVDIKAIRSINLIKEEHNYRAAVVVQFITTATSALKFQNCDFQLFFREDEKPEIALGTSQPKEILFPASETGQPVLIEKQLEVKVGKNEQATVERLIDLFNLIGNPESQFAMIISGTTEIGIKARRGWIYQGRIELADFTFYPTIQREVLFK
jgi:hypothetical protein